MIYKQHNCTSDKAASQLLTRNTASRYAPSQLCSYEDASTPDIQVLDISLDDYSSQSAVDTRRSSFLKITARIAVQLLFIPVLRVEFVKV